MTTIDITVREGRWDFAIQCGFCNGVGQIRGDFKVEFCPACHGAGRRSFRNLAMRDWPALYTQWALEGRS